MAKKKPLEVPMPKPEIWPVERLKPYDKNPNKHPEEQVTKIAASIREFGFIQAIAVRGEQIGSGHGRYAAAQRLGLERVPVVLCDHLTEEQWRAYIIADNRIARDSFFDDHLLAVELTELRASAQNLNILGFTEDEMMKLIGDGSKAEGGAVEVEDADDAPAAEEDPSAADDLTVIAHCTNFKQQLDVLNTLRGLGVVCETKGKKK